MLLLTVGLILVSLYFAPKLAHALEQTAIGRSLFWGVAYLVVGLIYAAMIGLIVVVVLSLRGILGLTTLHP